MSFGTDWTSFAGNWLEEWERTGDTKISRQDHGGDEIDGGAFPAGPDRGRHL